MHGSVPGPSMHNAHLIQTNTNTYEYTRESNQLEWILAFLVHFFYLLLPKQNGWNVQINDNSDDDA